MRQGFIERSLCAMGLYRKLRLIRNRYVCPELGQRIVQWRQFYSQFVDEGDLVFDVGANRGDRTETFTEMGARIVAVEPIPSLAQRLEAIFRFSPVEVEAVGVGAISGNLPLHVCSTTELSSFSDQFIESQRKQHLDMEWDRALVVRIITLDDLIAKHGVPSFIKIDVEGFESEALAGLSHPVDALSFEVRPTDSPGMTEHCLCRVLALGAYEFNLSLEETREFELAPWGDAEAVINGIAGSSRGNWKYADVYARRLKT